MQIIDLFSGIGGFSLAGHWLGWETIMFCEINTFGQKVLSYHFPGVPIYEDIKKLDYEKIRRSIDPKRPTIVVGGFPCQPYSTAGKRLGKEDDRHLWPYCIETVRELKPDYCVFENVGGLLSWNGGMVFDEVQADLEAAGYEVTPFLLPACAVNAPHRRDRIWFVAHSVNNDRGASFSNRSEKREFIQCESARLSSLRTTSHAESLENIGRGSGGFQPIIAGVDDERDAADSNGVRLRRQGDGAGESEFDGKNSTPSGWGNFPTQSAICNRNDGFPDRLAGMSFSKWRNESIKAMGNAVVPVLVLQIFKAIQQYEDQ